jgi:hypothetical protein
VNQVSGHQFINRDFRFQAIPRHGGGSLHHIVQFFGCLAGTKLLRKAQDAADEHHD